MACPYFLPTVKAGGLYWPFPQRLPLGAGFQGSCTAGGAESVPAEEALRDFCNVGYAAKCSRLPTERRGDALRFSIATATDAEVIVRYVCELDHAPVHHGELRYGLAVRQFTNAPEDPILLRQAECYVGVYLETRAVGG